MNTANCIMYREINIANVDTLYEWQLVFMFDNNKALKFNSVLMKINDHNSH